MLPFKFKTRKCEELIFRNAASHNMNFFVRVHTNPSSIPFNDLSKSLEYYDSEPTDYVTIVSCLVFARTMMMSACCVDHFWWCRTLPLQLRIWGVNVSAACSTR